MKSLKSLAAAQVEAAVASWEADAALPAAAPAPVPLVVVLPVGAAPERQVD